MFGVPHGEYAVDVANCRRCLCNDGEFVECEPSGTCQSIQPNPVSCQYDGETISHGDRFKVSKQIHCNTNINLACLIARLTAMSVVATMVSSGVQDGDVNQQAPLKIAVLDVIVKLTPKCVA